MSRFHRPGTGQRDTCVGALQVGLLLRFTYNGRMNERRLFRALRYGMGLAAIPVIAVVFGVSAAVSAQEPPPGPPATGGYVSGQVLVKFKPTVGQLTAQDKLASQGLQVVDAIPSIGVLTVLVEEGQEEAMVASLRARDDVLYAEPNYVVHALETIPDDVDYGAQWGLTKIRAPRAWDIVTGTNSTIIAIVDSGIDLDHPDLSCAGKLTAGYDFVNRDDNPDDDHGHGTHVAGIAGACTDNNLGVAGMSWGVRLMPVKVLDASGSGSYSDLAAGIIYSVDHGAQVINLSLGGIFDSQTMFDGAQYAHDHGVLVTAAAGNCAAGGSRCNGYVNPIMYPGAYTTTLAVAATDLVDNHAYFSEYHPYVDVAAPGVGIWSTYLGGGYTSKSGTSMATPFVSGLAGLIRSVDPALTRDEIQGIIESTAEDLGAPGKDNEFGHGRIDAWRALESQFDLQTTINPDFFLVDDDTGPLPPWREARVTSDSVNAITWTAAVSPAVTWVAIVPPVSGQVSADGPAGFTLVATRPVTYGSYSARVVVTATTPSGAGTDPNAAWVHIHYLPDLHQTLLFPVYRNSAPQ